MPWNRSGHAPRPAPVLVIPALVCPQRSRQIPPAGLVNRMATSQSSQNAAVEYMTGTVAARDRSSGEPQHGSRERVLLRITADQRLVQYACAMSSWVH